MGSRIVIGGAVDYVDNLRKSTDGVEE